MEITFPPQFPSLPPFIRVVYPRFKFHTGHVTVGGSICISLLTLAEKVGWNPDTTMSSVLLLLHTTLIAGNARVVNFQHEDFNHPYPQLEYSGEEARRAFQRVARDHGWEI